MPTKPCPNEPQGSQIIAQTLFLGASVSSFNASMGWGGQPSQLTVTLVEDIANRQCLIGQQNSYTIAEQYPSQVRNDAKLYAAVDTNTLSGGDKNTADHYHTCIGDACYVNKTGAAFTSTSMDLSERMVPGKVYYEFFPNPDRNTINTFAPNTQSTNLPKCFKSKYWYNPDPGFFGVPNRINTDNTYNNTWVQNNTNLNKGYDIIDTPVLFKMGSFTFAGLVNSWQRQTGQGGRIYNVTIDSMQSLLNSCHIIIGNYAGAVYSKLQNSTEGATGGLRSIYGGPRNYTGRLGVEYYGKLYEGNIPNLFNVYGFLESFGFDGFGGADMTSDGIPANMVIDALSVLTSSMPDGTQLKYANTDASFIHYAPRQAFSPFGRILAKTMQENDTYTPIISDFKRFGVIPPQPVTTESYGSGNSPSNRCQFLLDLSEIPRLPYDYRISGTVITITDLLNLISNQAGFDYYVDLVPLSHNNKYYNVLKVRTIMRTAQPRPNAIENAVKNLQCQNYALSSVSIGKEKNDNAARSVVFGGPIQRLYQASSYRLAYTQGHYIFNPKTLKFVDYMQLGHIDTTNVRGSSPIANVRQFNYGKTRTPTAIDTHNPDLSSIINPVYSGIYEHNNEIQKVILDGAKFKDTDDNWSDHRELGSFNTASSTSTLPSSNQNFYINSGNYAKATILEQENSEIATKFPSTAPQSTQRFFPLFRDVICPFFGFVMDATADVNTSGAVNDFKRVRPVWFDTWTGQIVVLMRVDELPYTGIGLSNSYSINGNDYWILTESEIRAAIQGFDEFLVYSLSKTMRTDLIKMLYNAYVNKDITKYKNEGLTDIEAYALAARRHNWTFHLLCGDGFISNIAGPFGQTTDPKTEVRDLLYNLDPRALRDLQMLHKFIQEIGSQYYGKKYMVRAPYISAYKDSSFAHIALPTMAGTAFVFSGGGNIHYQYEPTNDGAWEEHGNIIDNCIAVGSKEWLNLTDDVGKIPPLLGYNNNPGFDYIGKIMCQTAQTQFDYVKQNAPWNFDAWQTMMDRRDSSCDNSSFVFQSLDYSDLNREDYSLVEVKAKDAQSLTTYNQWAITGTRTPFTPFTYSETVSQARNSMGEVLNGLKMTKLFVKTNVEEKFIFLDPDNLKEPRILVNAPGLPLNNTSDSYANDPARTIVANIAMEDLAIYLRATVNGQRDIPWIRCMLSHISSVVDYEGFVAGKDISSANRSSNYALLSPKMAHPFFVGIPLRSNIHNYGPWTNRPYIEYIDDANSVFPNGSTITQSDDLPPVCTTGNVVIGADAAKKAFDNWITKTDVEQVADYVPWSFGGMAFLDTVAMNDVRNRTNYQNVLENAQIDMPGLPLFNLGGAFDPNNFAMFPSGVYQKSLIYDDNKFVINSSIPPLPEGLPILYAPLLPSGTTDTITYKSLIVSTSANSGLPVVTNIQTNVSQGGMSTTYSFRTYTRKLGFFNKENSDRIKKANIDNIRRNKQLANLGTQLANSLSKQLTDLKNARLENKNFSGKDLTTRLYGWSPTKVLIGQSYPYINNLSTPYDAATKKNLSALKRRRARLENNGKLARAYHTQNPTDDTRIPVSGNKENDSITTINLYGTSDRGDNLDRWISADSEYLEDNATIPSLYSAVRYRTDVGLYEEKEVSAQLETNYGLQAAMSLDGLFSPVSFYPTMFSSCFHFGYHKRSNCPFCNGTKIISTQYRKYLKTGYGTSVTIDVYCDKCSDIPINLSLKSSTTTSSQTSIEVLPPYIVTSGTDISTLLEFGVNQQSINTSSNNTNASSNIGKAGVSIPINMVSLQPIVVPYGDFKNPNVQYYSGVHPEGSGVHEDLSFASVFDKSTRPRTFFDRCRHSIEVVARGAVKADQLNIARGLTYSEVAANQKYINADYYDTDLRFSNELRRNNQDRVILNNQRFLGLRGPLVLHAWGYDLQGYPVPNAADEPYEVDQYNRPRRFKKKANTTTNTFTDIPQNSLFSVDITIPYTISNVRAVVARKTKDSLLDVLNDDKNCPEYKRIKLEFEEWKRTSNPLEEMKRGSRGNSNDISIGSDFTILSEEDDLENGGGFDPAEYRGSIISKTQKWKTNGQTSSSHPTLGQTGGKWSEKQKLKEFYLNWAERQDIWPVGPIDLRWDADRKVWATKSDTAASIYKMVYVTLEEDLYKEPDEDETYPARAFLDDVEYSNEPLPDGFRRLIFVKDKGGYTAPRGAKLLCRYSTDTGFYEPITKQSFVVGGLLAQGNSATIELSYIAGRKKGEPVPTMLVNFDNPFEFNIISGNRGLFTFMNGRWTLTAAKET